MVAYGFKKMFSPQIEARTKLQTVRGGRRRHARPCEPVQLFEAMRTRHCRKLLTPDPICVAVLPILLETTTRGIVFIEIDGRKLDQEDAEQFAANDGFHPDHINGSDDMCSATALGNMSAFWCESHPLGLFSGWVITWLADPS